MHILDFQSFYLFFFKPFQQVRIEGGPNFFFIHNILNISRNQEIGR